jgi:tetratricopeptide (TPR) repeat protein
MKFLSLKTLAAVAAISLATPAQAAWYQASSRHFIIFANADPRGLRDFAVKLEKLDKAMRVTREMDDPPVGDGNRLTIFLVGDRDDIERLVPDRENVAGFYKGRADGSIAVVPRSIGNGQIDSLSSNAVLFHEYAHHLMLSQIDRALPSWLVEGFAEFMATATVEKNGDVQLGWAPQYRARAMAGRAITPLPTLFAGDPSRLGAMETNQFYGTSWLLTHYLTFEPARRGQLSTYLASIAKGTEPLAAASLAFGDFKTLNRDLLAYLAKPKLNGIVIRAAAFGETKIDLQPLSPGAAMVMKDRIRSKVGVNKTTAEPLALRVRTIAARFPGDVLVQRTLAEAELDSGQFAAAEAAADRALAIDPRDTEAMILKGKAILAGTRTDRASAARGWFVSANKIDPEDPEPLLFFYRSFVIGGARPNPNAIAALHYASDLAPQDLGLRMTSAVQYLRDKKIAEGRLQLASVAYNPHGGALSRRARELLGKLDAANATGALDLLSRFSDPPAGKP